MTDAHMVCDYRPLKDEKYRVKLTIGCNKLDYHDKTASPTANLLDTKNLLNRTILDADKGSWFMIIDIKVCFLMIPLPVHDCKYIHIYSQYFDSEF